jgi:hypothetical protein
MLSPLLALFDCDGMWHLLYPVYLNLFFIPTESARAQYIIKAINVAAAYRNMSGYRKISSFVEKTSCSYSLWKKIFACKKILNFKEEIIVFA